MVVYLVDAIYHFLKRHEFMENAALGQTSTSAPKTVDLTAPTQESSAPTQESSAPTQETPSDEVPSTILRPTASFEETKFGEGEGTYIVMLSEQPEFPDANDGGQTPLAPQDQRAGVSQFPAESQPPQV